MDARRRLLPLLAALLLALGGCIAVETRTEGPADGELEAETRTEAPADGRFGTEGEPADVEDVEVPLEVTEGPGGSTLAFVPVTIRGEGPFPFALDTGASNSVIDAALADELGLPDVEEPREVQGVTGVGEARQLEIDDWQMGSVDLGTRIAGGIELGGGEGNGSFAGLIGSDVLSEYGSVLVDYANEVLVLSPRPETVEELGEG